MTDPQGAERRASTEWVRSQVAELRQLRRTLLEREERLRAAQELLAESERHLDEERAAHAALEAEHTLLTDVLESITNGFFSLDRHWRFTYFNRECERTFGRSRDELLGRSLWEAFPAAVGSIFFREYHRAIAEQVPVAFEAESATLPGTWFEVHAYPSRTGLSVHFHDITERKRAEQKIHFLAEAGAILASSLDSETTLASLVRLAVPKLADGCLVDVVEEDGRIRRVATAHVDPEKEVLTRELMRYPPEADGPNLTSHVLRTGQPWLEPEITDAGLAALSHHPEHLRILRALNLRSAIAVPLVARGRTLGVIQMATSESSRRYGPADLEVVEELARRAALAVDNARLYREAQRAIRAREQILRVVSHDLRNPLSAVFAHADLLRHTLDAQGREGIERRWIETICRAADQMNRLLRDLLDVNSLEAGRLSIEREECHVQTLLSEVLGMFRPLATERSLQIKAELPEPSLTVWADPQRMVQVFSNLIGNALRFTPGHGVITLRVEPAEGEVRFSVADTGAGIPAQELPYLFDPFWKGSTAGRGGSGLGLSIARGIVEAHGGRIWVEGQAGVGSTFLFTIPSAVAGAGALRGAAA